MDKINNLFELLEEKFSLGLKGLTLIELNTLRRLFSSLANYINNEINHLIIIDSEILTSEDDDTQDNINQWTGYNEYFEKSKEKFIDLDNIDYQEMTSYGPALQIFRHIHNQLYLSIKDKNFSFDELFECLDGCINFNIIIFNYIADFSQEEFEAVLGKDVALEIINMNQSFLGEELITEDDPCFGQ